MQGVNKTEDLRSLKTRQLAMQNLDNSFPTKGNVLTVVDRRGTIAAMPATGGSGSGIQGLIGSGGGSVQTTASVVSIVAGAGISVVSGTTSVTITNTGTGSTGPTSGITAVGTNYSDYLFWDISSSSWLVGDFEVHIGANAGLSGQINQSVAIGYSAGQYNQTGGIACGGQAGQYNQYINAIAIGSSAGRYNQNNDGTNGAIAIGNSAGNTGQNDMAVAIGAYAGNTNQQGAAIAIGFSSGSSLQGGQAIALGYGAGKQTQGGFAIGIGSGAGKQTQGGFAIGIGSDAGFTRQGSQSVAIGYSAGYIDQSGNAIAIGFNAAQTGQGSGSIAIGQSAAGDQISSQHANAIAIGVTAGFTNQGSYSVAIGSYAGYSDQSGNAIAIGHNAGRYSQGLNSIAIGSLAGVNSQSPNSIILNATGVTLDASGGATGFYVAPVRGITGGTQWAPVAYNTSSSELAYSSNFFSRTTGLIVDAGATLSNTVTIPIPGLGPYLVSGNVNVSTSAGPFVDTDATIAVQLNTDPNSVQQYTSAAGLPIPFKTIPFSFSYGVAGTTSLNVNVTYSPGLSDAILTYVGYQLIQLS